YRTATPMCVDVVKSMALKPTRSITGAIESVCAVSTPSAAQRHWLPSRREVSTSRISAMTGVLLLRRLRFQQPGNEACVDAAGLEFSVVEHGRVKSQIGRHTANARRRDRGAQASERGGAIRPIRDDLAHERIVERRYSRAR